MTETESRQVAKRALIMLLEVKIDLDSKGLSSKVLDEKIRNQSLEMNPEDVAYVKEGLGIH